MRLALLRAFALLSFVSLAGCGGGGGTPVTGEVTFGTVKPADGDRWSLAISDGDAKSYSAEIDPAGNFTFEKVVPGTYTIKVTHYAAAPITGGGDPKSGKMAKGPGMPEMKTHPDRWTVPGGPFTLDLSKLPATKK